MGDADLWRRLYVSLLDARLQLCEIRREALSFEIDAPDVTPERKADAITERDQVLTEWAATLSKLQEYR